MTANTPGAIGMTWVVFKRELKGYFSTPIASVFIVIFLVLTGIWTFLFGGFYERGVADLRPFFDAHAFLYLFLIPAIAMRLWAEERRGGTIELLLTLPITPAQAVAGKFLAAWCFAAIALVLTFPTWITANYLGDPDNGVVFAGYIGSLLMAGAYLAIGSCISATTRNQVIAFVVTFVVCGVFALLGFLAGSLDAVGVPANVIEVVGYFGFAARFESFGKGVIYFRDIFYFISLMIGWLFATVLVLDIKKAS